MFGGDEDDVVRAFAGNFNRRKKQRFSVDCAVDFEYAEFAELLGVDVLRRQEYFIQSCAGAHVVVLRSGDLGQSGNGDQEERESGTAARKWFHAEDPQAAQRNWSPLDFRR